MNSPMTETRAEAYRKRAAEIRDRGRRLSAVDIREKMEALARQYEQMAEVMERAQRMRGTPP
jgi:hypothetical protein